MEKILMRHNGIWSVEYNSNNRIRNKLLKYCLTAFSATSEDSSEDISFSTHLASSFQKKSQNFIGTSITEDVCERLRKYKGNNKSVLFNQQNIECIWEISSFWAAILLVCSLPAFLPSQCKIKAILSYDMVLSFIFL